MKPSSKKFNSLLKKLTEKHTITFDCLIMRMQPYEVSAFYMDLDSSYKFYSEKFFDEEKFKHTALISYEVDLDNSVDKDEVYENVFNYAKVIVSLNTLREFIKINEIDLGDTE
jgi:hypothetical protein